MNNVLIPVYTYNKVKKCSKYVLTPIATIRPDGQTTDTKHVLTATTSDSSKTPTCRSQQKQTADIFSRKFTSVFKPHSFSLKTTKPEKRTLIKLS